VKEVSNSSQWALVIQERLLDVLDEIIISCVVDWFKQGNFK
jgi:hypothetical protein